MRVPLRLNRGFWPKILTDVFPSADDPLELLRDDATSEAFSAAVSTLKFASTWKTTKKARFPLSLAALSDLNLDRSQRILDVGVSDGITSTDVMKFLPFAEYFVTDLFTEVFIRTDRGRTYFYTSNNECILIATKRWVLYEDTDRAIAPFGSIASSFYSRAPGENVAAQRIELINPTLRAKLSRTTCLKQYDIMTPWEHGKVDLVIAANLLNRSYFPEDELKRALGNLIGALTDHGLLALIENRAIEKATIFRFTDGCPRIERRVNGGSEIESLVTQSG
jgi:hypothetical protein